MYESVMITASVNHHCSTSLPLPKARWIPSRHRRATRNDHSLPKRTTPTPTTPLPVGFEDTGSAFPPGSGDFPSCPVTSPADEVIPEVSSPAQTPAHGEWLRVALPIDVTHWLHSGTWLLDPRLVGKKLDVRIQGTTDPPFQGGKFEGRLGFTVLTKSPRNVMDSNIVKLGYSENRLLFQAQHLVPETTTERDPFVNREAAVSIASVVGMRVVIIGPDLEGNSSWIGDYGFVVECPYPLQPDQACVQDLRSFYHYFSTTSLCRSYTESGVPINWYGAMIY